MPHCSIAGGVDALLFSLNQATGILTFLTARITKPTLQPPETTLIPNRSSLRRTADANQSVTIKRMSTKLPPTQLPST